MRSGLLGGKLKVTEVKCTPKNIGRSNETTGTDQAEIELVSRVNKKRDEGYFDTKEEAEEYTVILPMLAKDCVLSKLQYPVITSPKLDGMRALHSTLRGFTSRKNKDITTVNHIKLNQGDNAYIDGELYAHGYSFQEQMKRVKKYRKGLTEELKFCIYDVYIPDTDMTYEQRHAYIDRLVDTINVEVVPYDVASNEQELLELHTKYLSEGYEGTMVRINDVPYELDKRSESLLKFKDFEDETFTIVDVIANKRTPTQGTVVVDLGNGETTKCGMKMSHKDREELLCNKSNYIGKTAEVRFFERSDTGVPRFPVCHGIRLDK